MEFGISDYYTIGELITCWGAFLIIVNTFLSYALYDKRQRYFLFAACGTFFSSLFNLISVYFIAHFTEKSLFSCTLVTSLYFFFLLICPFIMTSYVGELAIQNDKIKKVFNYICGVFQSVYY